jgi:addiction module HigA family antidote
MSKSVKLKRKRDIPPAHPGRILKEEFLQPGGISQYRLAKATGLSPIHVSELVRGKRNVTAETALRLEEALGVSAGTWLSLQKQYELETAMEKSGSRIRRETSRIEYGREVRV